MPAAMRRLLGTPVPLTTLGRARPDRAASHESDCRGAAPDDDHVLVAEVLGFGVVGGVHMAADEIGHAGVVRHERRTPGAGRVHEELRRDLVSRRRGCGGILERLPPTEETARLLLLDGLRSEVLVVHEEVDALVHDGAHVHRAPHPEIEVLLESAVVVGDDLFRRQAPVGGVEAETEFGHARQVVDAVGGAEPQRGPAVLPGSARPGSTVEHDEILVGDELETAQVEGDGEAGLPGADHHDLHSFRARHHPSISARVRCVRAQRITPKIPPELEHVDDSGSPDSRC
jgi:hypothetical protein